MTAPGRPHGFFAPAGVSVGDRRGLTALGGVAVALLLGLAGGTADLLTGSSPGTWLAVGFVTGCVLAALTVHREDLVAAVVMPPLVYVALALISGAVAPASATGSFPVRQALDLANALVNGAPVLVGATLAALVVALVRWVATRR